MSHTGFPETILVSGTRKAPVIEGMTIININL